MKLILVRHGETIENINRIHQGWLPGKLSKKGKQQIKSLSSRLKSIKIDLIYTSDLGRCLETTKEIIKYHKSAKLIKEPLLRDMSHGIFSGKSKKLKYWEKLPGPLHERKPKYGESLRDVYIRIKKFYKNLIKNKGTILIVSHGGPSAFLQGLITKKTFEESLKIKGLSNASIHEFELTSKSHKIISLYDEKHLENI